MQIYLYKKNNLNQADQTKQMQSCKMLQVLQIYLCKKMGEKCGEHFVENLS